MRKQLLTSAVLTLCLSGIALADVKLPAIFGDHMVLQRGQKVPVWGTADAGEAVTVTIGETKANTTAGADGKWSVKLDSLTASEKPSDVTVAGKNTITFHDVLVGDVWVASGQSNMQFGMSNAHNSKDEIPKADHPLIRLFVVRSTIALEPKADCVGQWAVCTPESVTRFSAAGYFFAREIQEDQKVPVGMIGTYVGGTPAEAWTSLEVLKATPETQKAAEQVEFRRANMADLKEKYEKETLPAFEGKHKKWVEDGGQDALNQFRKDLAATNAAKQPPPVKPANATEPMKPAPPDADSHLGSVLYNGMVAPIIPYAIKGAIWYQGEANGGAPMTYRALFPAMINDWRTRWGQGDFPFIWVQLAPYAPGWKPTNAPTQAVNNWAGLREAQTMTLKLPNTGQAVIMDIGSADNIHPTDKIDVGHRLALAARHVAYGEDIVYSGPTYDAIKIESDKVAVSFKNVNGGLAILPKPVTREGEVPVAGDKLTGFSIAGPDKRFVWADAVIDGDKVIVSSPEVKEPVAVRYGWAGYIECNLYNKDGLPAGPFRSDDWSDPAPVRPVAKPAQ